jgi:hypothetical protein
VTAALDMATAGAGSSLVRITVSDEGIGIAEERLTGLASGFVQVDASETREYGGLGLGLAYVRRIAESHGGCLEEPQSKPGKGSSFAIVLPVGLVNPSRSAGPAGPAGPADACLAGGDVPAPLAADPRSARQPTPAEPSRPADAPSLPERSRPAEPPSPAGVSPSLTKPARPAQAAGATARRSRKGVFPRRPRPPRSAR